MATWLYIFFDPSILLMFKDVADRWVLYGSLSEQEMCDISIYFVSIIAAYLTFIFGPARKMRINAISLF
jgi:hypothetical protein